MWQKCIEKNKKYVKISIKEDIVINLFPVNKYKIEYIVNIISTNLDSFLVGNVAIKTENATGQIFPI